MQWHTKNSLPGPHVGITLTVALPQQEHSMRRTSALVQSSKLRNRRRCPRAREGEDLLRYRPGVPVHLCEIGAELLALEFVSHGSGNEARQTPNADLPAYGLG
jgi:hypothetical protein